MKVDLNMLPISKFWGILEWCVDNDIDTDKCVELIGADRKSTRLNSSH